jgi:hypothetical protein
MQQQKVSFAAIACAFVIALGVGCATKSAESRQGTVVSEGRGVSADDSGNPASCPNGELPLCIISNIDLSEGGPRPSDQCTPLIDVELNVGETSFTWSSPSGQLVDGVLVRSGTTSTSVYTYDPAVSEDSNPLTSPTHAQLTRITFCGTPGAHADAGTSPEPPPPTTSGDGGKTW